MKRVQAWTDRAFELIEFFKANNSQKGMREMLEQSKSCLISRQLAE